MCWMPTISKHKYKCNNSHTQNMNTYRSFWRRAGCPQAQNTNTNIMIHTHKTWINTDHFGDALDAHKLLLHLQTHQPAEDDDEQLSVLDSDESHDAEVLHCVAVCCSVLQCVAACLIVTRITTLMQRCCSVLQCVAACCSVLQCVAACCSVL